MHQSHKQANRQTMKRKDIVINARYVNIEGDEYIPLRYLNERELLVKFPATEQYQVVGLAYTEQQRVLDWSKPRVCGVGYCTGTASMPDRHNIKDLSYTLWRGMLQRCYDESNAAYKDVTVCEEWHNYRNFQSWFKKNYYKGCSIDKDLFSPADRKFYSPDTCCFLPKQINSHLTHLTSEDILHPVLTEALEKRAMAIALLLMRYEGRFTPRAEERLWKFCEACGRPRQHIDIISRQEETIRGLKEEIKEYKRRERLFNRIYSEYGLHQSIDGYISYDNEIYKINGLRDFLNLYKKVFGKQVDISEKASEKKERLKPGRKPKSGNHQT